MGLEPIGETTALKCPRCETGSHLVALDVGQYRVNECKSCTGLFVDHVTLRRLTSNDGTAQRASLGPRTETVAQARHSRAYLMCPVCAAVMNPQNFGRKSGAIVDVCTHHGTWFDAHELTRVVDFIANGGLYRAQAADLEQQKLAIARQLDTTKAIRSARSSTELGWDIGPTEALDLADVLFSISKIDL